LIKAPILALSSSIVLVSAITICTVTGFCHPRPPCPWRLCFVFVILITVGQIILLVVGGITVAIMVWISLRLIIRLLFIFRVIR
jgi:hypothetical protein